MSFNHRTLLDVFSAVDAPETLQDSEARYFQSIEADLQRLLNTRRSMEIGLSDRWTEVEKSVIAFGLNELHSSGLVVNGDSAELSTLLADRVGRPIVDAIRRFEPRLISPMVTHVRSVESIVSLELSARVRGGNGTIPVRFETRFDVEQHSIHVSFRGAVR